MTKRTPFVSLREQGAMRSQPSRASRLARREFLKQSCAITAAIGAGAYAAPTDVSPNPLACRLASYGKFEEAAWTHLPSIGIQNVFLNVPAPDEVAAIQDRLGKSGLTPVVMRGGADLSSPDAVDTLAAQLATCEAMGVHYMFLSPKHGDAPRESTYEPLRKAGDAAKSHGVMISLETHPDLGTNGDVHLETMQAINHPNVRVNFDTGNITYYNHGRNAVDELMKCIDFVGTVEFKDHNGEFETWVFPPLGTGITDFKGVLKVLQDHEYAGPITLEFEGTKGVELDEAGTKAAIQQSIAYVRSIGEFS